MPHGGGSVGGGGGGGGDWSSSNYHYYSDSSHSSSSGSGSGRGYICETYFCILSVIVAINILIVPISVTYTTYSAPLSLVVSPGETRIVSRSSVPCQGVSVSTLSTTVNSSLYLLQSVPKLTASNSFSISRQLTVQKGGYYEYYLFHLYPGSNYSLSACLRSGSFVRYFLLYGESSFDIWYDDPSTSTGNVVADGASTITNPCTISNTTLNQTFSSEDDYYFLFFNDGSTSATVQLELSFYRTEYSPESGDIIDNCTATLSSGCAFDLAYNSEHTLLLQTTAPSDGDWGVNVDVSTSCTKRSWVFAAIEMSMVGAVILLAPLVLLCVCRHRVKERICPSPDKKEDLYGL